MSFPFSLFFMMSLIPKKGTPIADIPNVKARKKTRIDYRLNFLMYQLAPAKPIIAPTHDQAAIHKA